MTSIADDYVHLDNEDTTTHLVKVVFVGDAGVGKTCLLNRLFTDEFNAQCPATIGCDFRFKRYTFDSKNVGVTLWDTAGAERFQSITTSYYRGAQGIVFVFDVTRRETFDSLQRYWLDEVAAHLTFPDAVRMIIGNKVDSASRRQVDSEEAAAFARKHGCMYQETSAKTDHNVHDALVWGLVCTIVDTPSLLRSYKPPTLDVESARDAYRREMTCCF